MSLKMDSSTKWGFVSIILAGVFTTFAIFTPYWLQNNYEPTFSKMGLWIRCSASYDQYRTNFYGSELSGECRWILVPYEYPLAFLAIQVSFLVSWILVLYPVYKVISHIFARTGCLGCEDNNNYFTHHSVAIVLGIGGLLGSIAVTLFAVMVESWTNRSSSNRDNFISWSFALAVLGLILEFVGAVIFYQKSRQEQRPYYGQPHYAPQRVEIETHIY